MTKYTHTHTFTHSIRKSESATTNTNKHTDINEIKKQRKKILSLGTLSTVEPKALPEKQIKNT